MAASDCLASSVASGSATSLMAVDSTKLLSRLLTKDDVAGVISELDSVANAVEGACAGLMWLTSWLNLSHPSCYNMFCCRPRRALQASPLCFLPIGPWILAHYCLAAPLFTPLLCPLVCLGCSGPLAPHGPAQGCHFQGGPCGHRGSLQWRTRRCRCRHHLRLRH